MQCNASQEVATTCEFATKQGGSNLRVGSLRVRTAHLARGWAFGWGLSSPTRATRHYYAVTKTGTVPRSSGAACRCRRPSTSGAASRLHRGGERHEPSKRRERTAGQDGTGPAQHSTARVCLVERWARETPEHEQRPSVEGRTQRPRPYRPTTGRRLDQAGRRRAWQSRRGPRVHTSRR